MNDQMNRVEIFFGNALKIEAVPEPRGHTLLVIKFDQFVITTEGDHVMFKLPADHTVQMQVGYTDAKGNPATIDGDVSWDCSDDTIAAVHVDPTDSTKVRVVPVGAVGQVQITATCDADIGEGERELVTLCDIEVIGGEAVAGTITPLGEPVPVGAPDQSLPGAQPGVDNTLPSGAAPKQE